MQFEIGFMQQEFAPIGIVRNGTPGNDCTGEKARGGI